MTIYRDRPEEYLEDPPAKYHRDEESSEAART